MTEADDSTGQRQLRRTRSDKLYERAKELIPGGVNSPVRAFKSVGGDPVFIARGDGAHVFDVDGNRYIDYVASWGPLILGHADESVIEAITRAAKDGTSFGAATAREVELAERVISAVPSLERVRFVNSGTEATMSAIRLARGFTGRDRIIKFSGCYHGHADAFLAEGAGSGLATLGIPGSAGVPEGAAADTLTLPYNDLDAVADAFTKLGDTIAAIIVEPIACNMGYVPPSDAFLPGLRELCTKHGAVLILDEVMTGFRVALGGAQSLYNVKPDLSTFGKVIGGGLPVGAYGGRAEIMGKVAPEGPVYQAGTLSGNPLAMAAGLATLEKLAAPEFFSSLEERMTGFEQIMRGVLEKHGNPAVFGRTGSIFGLWFNSDAKGPPKNYEEAKRGDTEAFAKFFQMMLNRGIYLAPSAFEVGFVSSVHTDELLQATATAVDRALESLLA